ncbi:ABC transporter permease [Jiangella asiatica]|uniref:ABC transporter permease n=1 Tax=Jiangella asiatica TaxID=2530372 RepID=UPI0013A5EEA2|nr:ABC transporter permease [Jiangella asiatica]
MAHLRLYLSAGIIAMFVLVAVLGPVFYEFDPVTTDVAARLLPPLSSVDGTSYPLGTDPLGRDLLGQIIYGARISLGVAAGTVLGGLVVGAVIGIISGYFGGRLDSFIMRLADIQLAVPPILLAILMVAVLGPGIQTLIVALAITRWVFFARVSRSSVLVARERPFVEAARVSGLSHRQIMMSHIARFTVSPLLVVATMQIGLVILAEAALSFLGLGASAQEPSWGLIIANGRGVLLEAWWISTLPGVALSLLVVSVAVFGDELRDRLQPDLRLDD